MATSKRTQKQPDLNTAYFAVGSGIVAYAKSLNETTDTPIGDFYKAIKVSQALKQVDVTGYTKYRKHPEIVGVQIIKDDYGRKLLTPKTAEITTPDINEFIDYEAIKKKLVKHTKEVRAYFSGLMSSPVFLTKTVFYVVPPENSPEFEAMASCFKQERVEIPKELGRGGATVFKINPKKVDKLLGLIQKLPQSDGYTLNVLYEANPDTSTDLSLTPRTNDQAGYLASTIPEERTERYTLLLDLVEKCGIKPEGMTRQTLNIGGQEQALTDTHSIVERILTDVLAYIFRQYAFYEAGESSEVTNLIDGKSHGFIMRPANMSLYEAFESAVYNPNQEFNTIFKKYRTPQELDLASGLHLSIAEQAVLPFLTASNDLRQFQALMIRQIPLFYDLILALQDYKREHPDTNGGWVDVKELAKFIPRYAHDIEIKGSLRPQYRTLIADTYQLLKLFEIPFEKATKANGNKVYKYFKFINIDEVEVDKRGNIKALKLDFTQDYYALYSQKVAVILDGMRELDDPQVKMLGARISDYFVCNEPIMAKTIKGEPLAKKASELARWAGLSGNEKNPQRKYSRLADILNGLASNGRIVGKWENTTNHRTDIKGYGKGLGETVIAVYPSENIQNSLITKAQRRASRRLKEADQRNYQRLLKKYAEGYTDKDVVAENLGINKRTLENMLAGVEPITSEVMEKVEDELSAE